MRNEEQRNWGEKRSLAGILSDIFLLLVNSVGIVGALTETLQIPWRELKEGYTGMMLVQNGLDRTLFWGGVFLLGAVAVLIRSGANGKKTILRAIIFIILYFFLGLACRKWLTGGISMALENAVANLNERYEFHIAWAAAQLKEAAGWDAEIQARAMTGGVLYLLFPLILLAGLFGRYDKGFCLILGNALWFTVACACDRFPGFFFLAVCVLGAVATLIQKEFRSHPGTGAAVVSCAMILTVLVMAMVFRYFLPVLDIRYEEILERRMDFYTLVNEEWIPWVKNLLPGGGFGSGVDVTGELGRSTLFSYTAGDVYRVTVDQKPQGAMYLKGFIGGTYGGKEWLAWQDRDLEGYYKKLEMELPKNYGELVNLSYEAARKLQRNAYPAHIHVEELGGRGSYSIYPYGALLTDEYQVHGDGSVVRKSNEYMFQYYVLSGFGRQDVLSEEQEKTEQQYRRYVYDNYLDYPREELPRLTRCLETSEIRTDNVYVCVLDLIHFLDSRASYNLDVENNPSGTDFVEYFLFDSQEGYCAHFASAAVLALRYFGIPARYVAGYTVSPSDFVLESGGTYSAVLTGRQAHAWAEIYLDTIGWVPVEMTPGAVAFAEDNRMEQLGMLGQLSGQGLMLSENEELWNPDRMGWQKEETESEIPDYSPEPFGGQMSETETVSGQIPDITEADAETEMGPSESRAETEKTSIQKADESLEKQLPLTKQPGFRIIMKALAIVLLTAALVCLEKWDESRRREMFRKADTRERIFLLYRNFRNVFQTAGIRRNMDIDGAEFRILLRDSFQVNDMEYQDFCRILEKNSFGKEAPSEPEFQELYFLYDRLTKQAYQRVSFCKKMCIKRYRNCV